MTGIVTKLKLKQGYFGFIEGLRLIKQVLILCGGKATRLRPYSNSHSKAELAFLDRPLLAYPWKLAEDLENNCFFLNSHLFPSAFKKVVHHLSQKNQQIKIVFEKQPLGATGTLYSLKKELQKKAYLTYINGDCLLFPSSQKKLMDFEKEFLTSQSKALLYVIPKQKNKEGNNSSEVTLQQKERVILSQNNKEGNNSLEVALQQKERVILSQNNKEGNNSSEVTLQQKERIILSQNNKEGGASSHVECNKKSVKKQAQRFLYCDSKNNLKEVRLPEKTDTSAYIFTGLALFKSSLLDHLKEGGQDLFSDFLTPLLTKEKIKLFIDKKAISLEAGDNESYLKSQEFCLQTLKEKENLTQNKKNFVKERLQEISQRFCKKT